MTISWNACCRIFHLFIHPGFFKKFPCPSGHDSNEWVLIRLQQSLMTSWSLESGVLEQGSSKTVQGRGPPVPGVKNSGIHTLKLTGWLMLQKCVMHHSNLLFLCYCYMAVKLYGGLNWKAHAANLKKMITPLLNSSKTKKCYLTMSSSPLILVLNLNFPPEKQQPLLITVLICKL